MPGLDWLRSSVRAKLLCLVLAPLMLGFPVMMGLVWYWGEAYYHRLMVSRVGSDLVTANAYFQRVIDGVGGGVDALAASQALSVAREGDALPALLGAQQTRLGLDFLNLLDAEGRVLHAATGTAA
ncbi:MAG TPA: two-component sensor histidine kinase, partial [Thauera sp.]|nr:two-component sensor histidine kinase [Thauera sp.]